MQSETILNKDENIKAQEIGIKMGGNVGELGIKNVKALLQMIEDLKGKETPQKVDVWYSAILGYYSCCVNCDFVELSDEFLERIGILAEIEYERAEAQQSEKGEGV